MIEIRNVKAGDYDQIIPQVNDWWGGREVAPLLPRLFFTHFCDTSYVADSGGKIAGFVVGFMSPAIENEAYIHFTGVNPDFRRSGIASALYEHFFAVAKRSGRDTVRCITSPENTASIAFHTALGFAANAKGEAGRGVEATTDYDGPEQDRVQFVKRLSVQRSASTLTCYIRYTIDMHKVDEFEEYARRWIPLVECFGGTHHGYFLPHESNSDLAVALFSFPSLAEYERYRTESMNDEECQAAYRFANETRCILRYERQFLRPIEAHQ